MIKDYPSLKSVKGACSVASEDESDILIFLVNQVLFMIGY